MKHLKMLAAALLCAFALGTAQAAVDAKEVAQLMKVIDASMFPPIASASMRLTSYKNESVSKEIAMDLMLKADQGLIAFSAPATDKGKYILKSGKNLWMFFSDIKRSIRLSTRDSFMGTDATNYDMLQLNLVADYDVSAFEESALDGRRVVRVELAAKPGTEGYAKITSWVDPEQKRLLKNDCYSLSGALIKTIHYQQTQQVGSYRIPQSVLIVNHLDKSRTTAMKFLSVKPQDDIPSSVFTLGYLESLN